MKKMFGALSASGGAMLLASASFLSYIVGFGRDLLVANFFGASGESDAFYAGFLLPDFVFTFLVLGFVSGALLPIFIETEKKEKAHAEKVFHSFLTLTIIATGIFAAIAFFLAPTAIHTFFPEATNPEQFIRTTRILLLSPLIFSISNSLGMILLSRKHFFSMAISPALYNVGIIAGILLFGKEYGAEAGAWGAVFGAVLHLLSRLIDFPRTNVSLRPSLTFFSEIGDIIKLGLPKTLGLVAFQATIIVFTILANNTIEGGVAAWNFARNVQSLPVSLFGIAFATAALPFLSDAFAEKKKEIFSAQLQKSMVQILVFTLCAAVGMSLLGQQIVSVLFEHGAFTNSASVLTASILIPLALATPFEGLTHLFSRAFLAHKKTVFPALGRFLFLGTATTLSLILLPTLGLSALGVAFVCAAAFEVAFLLITFHFVCVPLSLSARAISHIFIPAISVTALVCAVLFFLAEYDDFFQLIIAIALSATTFIALTFFLPLREVKEILFRK